MKLSGPSSTLLEALTSVSLALPTRQSLPALTLVRIDSSPKETRLVADCLDACVQVTVQGLQSKGEFSILVSPRLLRASLRGEQFELVLEDQKLLVESSGRSTILTTDVKEFPKDREKITTHEVDAKALLHGIKTGLNCAEPQSDSPRNGVVYEHGLGLVGGDGKCIHLKELDLGIDRTIIIPRFSAGVISGLVSWEEPLYLGLERHTLYIEQGDSRCWLQLSEAQLSSMKQAFAADPPKTCCVARESMDNALESLAPFVGASLGRVSVHVMPTHIVLSASSDGNKSSAMIECVLEAKEDKFSVLLNSLSRAIKHWTSDTLSIHREPNFIQIRPDDASACRAVVLLLREEA